MHDDDMLVYACQSGDIDAFEQLVRKYQDRTVRVLYLLLSDADDAQDAAQETFIRAFRCIKSFKHNSSFGTWLHRVAINTARNWARNNKRGQEVPSQIEGVTPANQLKSDDLLVARERSLEVKYALSRLPQYYREAIVLRHYDDLSYEEIALVQQVPVGTVRSRLAKARTLLKQYLTEDIDRSNM
ncbi:MAG: sigma-70 family RNA polymerase sigma factor [Armatimonadota bacterium]